MARKKTTAAPASAPVAPVPDRAPLLARPIVHALLIVVIGTLTMSPLFSAQFTTWDDASNFADNPVFKPATWDTIAHFWREPHAHLYVPITYTVWGLLAMTAPDQGPLTKLSPALFHGTNVLLHLAAALVVWALLRRLIGTDKSPLPALLGALLFAVHPVQVEPVGWASGTKDVLAALLMWSAVLLLVRSGDTRGVARWSRYAVATLLAAAAMLAKPSAVVAPLVAGVIAILAARQPWRHIIVLLIPWAAMSAACVHIARQVQPPVSIVYQPPLYQRPLVATDALAFYLFKTVWPVSLGIDHGRDPAFVLSSGHAYFTWVAPLAALGLLVCGCRRLRGRERAAGAGAGAAVAPTPGGTPTAAASPAGTLVAGALAAVLCLAPVLGLVPFDFQQYSTVAEHYMYPAMAGVAIVAAVGLLAAMNLVGAPAAAVRRGRVVVRRAPAWLAGLLVVVLAARSVTQALTWKDNLSLFAQAVETNPDSRPGQSSLALTLMDTGRPDQALPHARRATELAPNDAGFWIILSNAHRQLGQLHPALEAGERALAAAPEESQVVTHVGSLYAQRSAALAGRNNPAAAQRDADVARARLEQAVALDPKLANARLNLGTFYFQTGRIDDALRELKLAADLAPTYPLARANYGFVLLTHGDLAPAREQFEAALKLQPNLPLAIDGLQEIRRRQGGR